MHFVSWSCRSEVKVASGPGKLALSLRSSRLSLPLRDQAGVLGHELNVIAAPDAVPGPGPSVDRYSRVREESRRRGRAVSDLKLNERERERERVLPRRNLACGSALLGKEEGVRECKAHEGVHTHTYGESARVHERW